MSEQIDWSKAPADATHYSEKYGAFFRESTHKDLWIEIESGCAVEHPGCFIARPTTPSWSGEGLPPVGVVCEYHSGYVEQPFEYAQCEIIAHFEGEQSKKLAAFKYTAHDGVVQLGRGAPGLFRPIRTHEQIASDEREAAVDEMHELYMEGAKHSGGLYALYDAGYRKQ